MKNPNPFGTLGLCRRAGFLAMGELAVEKALQNHTTFLVILAQDASENTKKKFCQKAQYYHIPVRIFGEKAQLGNAIGKEIAAVLAITDRGFAEKLSPIETLEL